jgi:NADH:ubiquinone oxidoreductase subunit E
MGATSKADESAVSHVVDEALDIYGEKVEELVPILTRVNREYGYLAPEALAQISKRLRIPQARVHAVASFYHMLFTQPVGQHVVKFCESAPCHVIGGREVWAVLQDELKLSAGETSQDGKWTLLTTSCLGLCDEGPVIMVDEDIHLHVSPEQIPQILAKYQ